MLVAEIEINRYPAGPLNYHKVDHLRVMTIAMAIDLSIYLSVGHFVEFGMNLFIMNIIYNNGNPTKLLYHPVDMSR